MDLDVCFIDIQDDIDLDDLDRRSGQQLYGYKSSVFLLSITKAYTCKYESVLIKYLFFF